MVQEAVAGEPVTLYTQFYSKGDWSANLARIAKGMPSGFNVSNSGTVSYFT